MAIRRLPTDDPAITRYVEEIWLPYHRDLAAIAFYEKHGFKPNRNQLTRPVESVTHE